MKSPKKSQSLRILHILMVLCAAGILGSALLLWRDSREYTKGDAVYRQVRLVREAAEVSPQPARNASAQEEAPAQDDGMDFTALSQINLDVVGWLTSEDGIDYPVVQGTDNEFYLGHLFTGERNKLGSIFMDYRNHSDFSDPNTVLYGHSMKDGSMFSDLLKYKDQRYYDEFPTMTLSTPAGDYTIEFFAGSVIAGSGESLRFSFQDDADFQGYVASLREISTFQSGTTVESGDRIITLCTCSYEFDNARYALFGKLTP